MLDSLRKGTEDFLTVPSKFFKRLQESPIYWRWHIKESRRVSQFRHKHQGETCFIIGNGPSLRKMDLSPLRNLCTFGLNKIYLIFDQVDINLTYHVAVNPLVIQQSALQFESLTCPSFLSIKAAHGVVTPRPHIYYLLTDASTCFQGDITRSLYEGYTVTYVAMQLAFYMGFETIFLIGVDHNFTFQGKPNEKQRLMGEDPNHFAPHYFGNQEWNLPDLEQSERAFQLAKEYFEKSGRRIYDATLEGNLNIFPKISYEEALDSSSRRHL